MLSKIDILKLDFKSGKQKCYRKEDMCYYEKHCNYMWNITHRGS